MIQKQAVNVNFAKGLNTKTDPWQIALGNFLSLENTIFTTEGQLKKRNGFGALGSFTSGTPEYATTLNSDLTTIGSAIEVYSPASQTGVNKGSFQPISLSTMPLARSAINQTQCDAATAPNGYICVVYTEVNNGSSAYKYIIENSTGAIIVNPTALPSAIGTPRVFVLSGFFFIVYTTTSVDLEYIAISISNTASIVGPILIATGYGATSGVSWDGVVLGSQLFIAYDTSSGGQAVNITYISSKFGTTPSATSFSSSVATSMSLCADPVANIIYASFYDSGTSTGYVASVDINLHKRMTPTEIISSGTIYNITASVLDSIVNVVYEVANTYGYDSDIPTNYLNTVTVTPPASLTTGTVGSTTTFIRSVGLASKSFVYNGVIYVLAEYASVFQSTYFLIKLNGNIISRFAYENGGAEVNPTTGEIYTSQGYLPNGLPSAQVIGSTVYIPYLYKDLIETTNNTANNNGSGVTAPNNVYTQTGVNLTSIAFSSETLSASEIGGNLNISGGILWTFDGQTINEQGFHVWPDNIELSLIADPTPTGSVSTSVTPTVITSVSSVAGIVPGMNISGTGVAAGATVVSVGTTTVTMSLAATGTHSSETITFTGNMNSGGPGSQQYYYQVIYEFTDAAGNVIRSAPSIPATVTTTSGHSSVEINIPTLRLSYKTGVKIQIYRWSEANQIYYQVTSLTAPFLNNPADDYLTYTDIANDSSIVGNNIIYTTGSVLEDIAGPAATATTLYDDRLWLIDAEDQNLLWFSKQIIEATPVEMSDLLTLYVAPSTGAQGSTGNITALAPMDDKLIIFKANACYYINGAGQGPDNTGANNNYSTVIFITSSVGCANQNSIVLIPNGLMFQSDKGIWLLGRDLSTSYIGAAVEAFNSYTVTSAISVPGTTQVRFTLSNGAMLVYDYFYEQWSTFNGAAAVASTLYNGLHTLVTSTGGILQETPGIYLDNGNPVLLSFVTSWLNLGGLQGYQRAFFFYLLGQYLTPHKLNIQIAYDYIPAPTQSTLISPTNFSPAYGNTSPYGQGTYGGSSNVENWRVFLAKQRCSAFQITLQESYDPSYGVAAGAGLTLSGINLVVGIKKGFRPIAAAHTAGGGVNSG